MKMNCECDGEGIQGRVRYPIDDGVEGLASEGTGDGGGVVDISADASGARRVSADAAPAIEQRELDTSGYSEIGAGGADDPSPSDEGLS
jgi:hypothetical protein